MLSFKSLMLASSLLMIGLIADVEAADSSIKVAVSVPSGSSGATMAKTLPTATKFSPCSDTTKFDALTFTVDYKVVSSGYDVYIVFYNPDATDKFVSVSKDSVTKGVAIKAHATPAALSTALPYQVGADMITLAAKEVIFGGPMRVDATTPTIPGLTTGTWQLIGVVADPATFDFKDPATWSAWDVATVVLGMPWKGSTPLLATCQ